MEMDWLTPEFMASLPKVYTDHPLSKELWRISQEVCETDRDGLLVIQAIQIIERSRPIPVSERLPELEQSVLVWPAYTSNPAWLIGALWPDGWLTLDGDSLQSVTHWLPLPPKPE